MRMKRIFVFCLFLIWGGGTVWAADAATKLGRGITNAGFGWFEIVNEVGIESDQHGLWIGVPSGLLRGAASGVLRMLAGVYEVATFPLPNGKKGYEPILLPESVFKRR